MKLLFCRSRLPGSVLIRWMTMSQWSHVALVCGDMAIEATWPVVRLAPVQQIIDRHSAHEFATIQCDEQQAWDFADAQRGKRYDWTALLGAMMQRDWQETDAWFCSELVAAAVNAGGRKLFRATDSVTPAMIYQVSE